MAQVFLYPAPSESPLDEDGNPFPTVGARVTMNAYYEGQCRQGLLVRSDPNAFSAVVQPAVYAPFALGYVSTQLSGVAGVRDGREIITVGRSSVDDGGGMKFAFALGVSVGADGYLKINCSDGQWQAITPEEVGYMDIRWFGAVASRDTNSSAAIQAAVDAAGNNGRVFVPWSEYGYKCQNIEITTGWVLEFFGEGYNNVSNAAKGSAEWSSVINLPVRGSYLVIPAGEDGIILEKSVLGSVGVEFNNMAIQGLGAGADRIVDAYRGSEGYYSNMKCNKFGTFNAEYGIELVSSYANRSLIDHAASGCTYPISLGLEGTGLGVTALTIINPHYNGNEHCLRFGNCVSVVVSGGLCQGVLGSALMYGECAEVEINGIWFEGLHGTFLEMISGGAWTRQNCGFVRCHIDGTFADDIEGARWYMRACRATNLTLRGQEGSMYVSPDSVVQLENIAGFSFHYEGIGNTSLAITSPGQNVNVNLLGGISRVDLEMTANGSLTLSSVPDLIAGSELLLTVKSTGAIRTLTINCDLYAGGGATIPWTAPGGADDVCTARLTRSGFGWTIAQGAWV